MKIQEYEEINPYTPSKKFLGFHVLALVETLCFFLFLFGLALLSGTALNYFSICPHPFWIIVVLIASQYGTLEALFAATISSLILFLGQSPERDVFQESFEYFFQIAKTPILWFISAVILGELRMRHIRERNHLREVAIKAEENQAEVAKAYIGLKTIKEALEIQVATESKTALAVIASFKEIEKLNKEGLIKGTLDLVKALVNPAKCSIYFVVGNALEFSASYGWHLNESYTKQFHSDHPLFKAIIHSKILVFIHNHHNFLGKDGLAAVPIIDQSKGIVFGMIKIEQISFIKLKPVNLKILQHIGELVGKAYSNDLDEIK